MKIKFFVAYLVVVLLCLSLDSCKNSMTLEEGGENVEVANNENDNKEAETDSLSEVTAGSKIKAKRMEKKEVILRKTKAQYVIY